MIEKMEQARQNMVNGQLMPNKVTHKGLLAAMATLPRERFVPAHMQSIAYLDEDISLGNGRYLPEPLVLARLVQAADVRPTDIVLDVGCGTGYSSAVLGQLASTVVGIEQDKNMAERAEQLLHDLDICNAVVVQRPQLSQGYAEQGPYDVILINGSVSSVPDELVDQLADGGRLVAVLSDKGHMGSAMMITRHGAHLVSRALFDAAVPTLAGFEKKMRFMF